jgi:antitoxin component YwqK of YwqJK toxin-antitoxin module
MKIKGHLMLMIILCNSFLSFWNYTAAQQYNISEVEFTDSGAFLISNRSLVTGIVYENFDRNVDYYDIVGRNEVGPDKDLSYLWSMHYSEVSFKNGLKDGYQKIWSPSGHLMFECDFKVGKVHGTMKRWDSSRGFLLYNREYINGQIVDGIYEVNSHVNDGDLRKETFFGGVLTKIEYSVNQADHEAYQNTADEYYNVVEWGASSMNNGSVYKPKSIIPSNINLLGTKVQNFEFVEVEEIDSVLYNKANWMPVNGNVYFLDLELKKICYIEHQRNGKRDGLVRRYYHFREIDGHEVFYLKLEESWVDGFRNGTYNEFYKNGKILKSRLYKKGRVVDGFYKCYSEQGKVEGYESWKNGEIIDASGICGG